MIRDTTSTNESSSRGATSQATNGSAARPTVHGATSTITAKEFQRLTGRRSRREERLAQERTLRGPDGRILDEHLIERPCPGCHGLDRSVVFEAGGVDYVKCRFCSLLHVGRYVSYAARERIMPSEPPDPADYLAPVQRDFDLSKFRHGVELIRRYSDGAPRVLDIGTGFGLFLEALGEVGLTGTGLESYGETYDRHHRDRGLDVIYGRFEEADLAPGAYNVLSFWDCLEHIVDPGAVLERCRKLLPPGGLLLVLVPNAGSLAARAMRERCAMFDGIEHINMFTPATLRAFVEARGFETVHLETIIPEINVLNNYLDYDDPYHGESGELDRVLGVDVLSRETILKHDLGYKILTVLRNRAPRAA